jgi:hypothetical protein
MAMCGAKGHNRFLVLAVALSVSVAVCSVAHVGPMNGASEHAHGASSICVPDLCVTITSKDPSLLLGSTAGFFLLLSALLVVGSNPRLSDMAPPYGVLLADSNHLPRASNKLYRLHAVYRL